jgi:signal transduction histidine kinase
VPEAELLLKTEQLLQFRMAFAAVCLALALALKYFAHTELDLQPIFYLLAVVLAYTALGFGVLKTKITRTDFGVKVFSAALLAFDITALTAAIHFTLGIESDLYVLYLLPILLASYSFSGRGIFITCCFISLSYVALLAWENLDAILLMNDATQTVGLAGAYLHRLVARLIARSAILVSVTFLWGAFCAHISGLAQQVTNRLREQLKNNERLVAEIQAQAAREKLINSINSALRNTLDLERILEIASHELTTAINAGACAIVCPNTDPTKEPTVYQDGAGGPDKLVIPSKVCSHILANRSKLDGSAEGPYTTYQVINDPHTFPQFDEVREQLTPLGLTSLIVQLMMYGDSCEGIILIGESKDRWWATSELELIRTVAGQVAVAIENSKLVQKLSATNQDLMQKNLHLDATNLELRAIQAQLVHQEKMASLGRLVAGIAHELNNPINFVHGNLPYLSEYFNDLKNLVSSIENLSIEQHDAVMKLKDQLKYDFVVADLENIIADLNEGTQRIRHIIRNLRSFSRLDEAELKEASIDEGIESTLKILSQYYGRDKIPVDIKFESLPPILCYPGQLNQVWMNLLSNAAQAIDGVAEPKVSIRTKLQDDQVLITIEDNGPGITKDVQTKIFEPFFTTKPVGQGTGLGLSICHSIIERHRGKIWFETDGRRGTIFKVLLPVYGKPVEDFPAEDEERLGSLID